MTAAPGHRAAVDTVCRYLTAIVEGDGLAQWEILDDQLRTALVDARLVDRDDPTGRPARIDAAHANYRRRDPIRTLLAAHAAGRTGFGVTEVDPITTVVWISDNTAGRTVIDDDITPAVAIVVAFDGTRWRISSLLGARTARELAEHGTPYSGPE
jgi:hypothetical protein